MISLGKIQLPAGLDVRQKRGWFRIWMLLTLGWVFYACTQTQWPWQVTPSTFIHEIIYNDQNFQKSLSDAQIRSARQCDQDSISIISGQYAAPPAQPKDPNDFLKKIEHQNEFNKWNSYLSNYSYDSIIDFMNADINSSHYPTHWYTISCIKSGTKRAVFLESMVALLAPPIAIPLLILIAFFVIRGIGLWLLDGFKPSRETSKITAPASSRQNPDAVQNLETEPEAIIEVDEQDQSMAVQELADLKKGLSWSILGAMLLDQFARAVASGGKSHGTNILLFALSGLFSYFAAKAYSRRFDARKATRKFGIGVFWTLALLIITLTTARYR